MKKRVILQVLPALETGGVELGTLDISRALCAAGHKSIVASAGDPLVKSLTKFGAMHITMPLKTKNPYALWENADQFRNLIREHNIDIVHARSRAPAWSSFWACWKEHIPFLTTFHGTYNFLMPGKKYYNSVMVRGDHVIAGSQFIANHIQEYYTSYLKDRSSDRIRTIYRGIDCQFFNPKTIQKKRLEKLSQAWNIPKERSLILMPARLTRWKGHAVLIKALERIKTRNWHCLLVGSDQGRESYRQELHKI
jgi:glycosyltransferase involved in cell wall biosynthesis